jgi:hypothetical protein
MPEPLAALEEVILMTKDTILELRQELKDIKLELYNLKDTNGKIFEQVSNLITKLITTNEQN